MACRADLTVTFVAAKRGMVTPDARHLVGLIRVASLGLPDEGAQQR